MGRAPVLPPSMSASLSHDLLARLEPLKSLGEDALRRLATKASTLALAPRSPLRSGDVHRWHLYLLEGELSLIEPGRSPVHIEAGALRARQPLFRAGDTRARVVASHPCRLLKLERELVDVLRQQADTSRYDIVDLRISPAEGRLFRQIYDAYGRGELVVPCMPVVVRQVQALAGSQAPDIDRLARLIQADPSLTAGLLRAARGLPDHDQHPMDDLDAAMARIGHDAVPDLACRLAGQHVFEPVTPELGARMLTLWRSSFVTALLSRILAGHTRHVDPERALLAGLVVHVGAIAILDHVNRHVVDHDADELDAAIGDLEIMVGELVLSSWGLGGELAATLDESSAWLRDHRGDADICDVVLLARRLELEMTGRDARLPPIATLPALARLQAESDVDDLPHRVLEEGEREVAKTTALLQA